MCKNCIICDRPESEEVQIRCGKCRLCYNAERMVYYYKYAKNGKTKPNQTHAEEDFKTCKSCNLPKLKEDFYVNKVMNGKTYYTGKCKDCCRGTSNKNYRSTKSIFENFQYRNSIVTRKDGTIDRYDSNGILI